MHHFKYTYYYLFNKNYISVQLSYWYTSQYYSMPIRNKGIQQ